MLFRHLKNMRFLITCLFAFFLFSATVLSDASCAEPANMCSTDLVPQQWIDGKVLVQFAQTTSEDDIQLFIEKYGCKTVKKIEKLNIYNLELPETLDVIGAIRLFYKDKHVVFAQPNYIYTAP